MHNLTYAGRSSSSYNLVVERYGYLSRPSKKYEKVSVPGRNGDIYLEEDAWNNYEQAYEVWSGGQSANAPTLMGGLFDWLYPASSALTVTKIINLEVNGYHQLTDSAEPNVIRLVNFTADTEVENHWNHFGRAIIRFDCRPERFTSDAFTAITKTTSGATVSNPGRPSKPCIKVYGSGAGSVTVNGYVCTISNISSYLHLDSDSQNCFKDITDQNQNSLVTLTNGFPILSTGSNTITWTGGVTKVDIYPRWWNL